MTQWFVVDKHWVKKKDILKKQEFYICPEYIHLSTYEKHFHSIFKNLWGLCKTDRSIKLSDKLANLEVEKKTIRSWNLLSSQFHKGIINFPAAGFTNYVTM